MATKSSQETTSTEQIEELLDAVDLQLDRLKTLYEQYFLGIQKQAPSFIHSDVERKLRDLSQLNIRNTGLRYRLATLQQKFGSYNSYWRRTLRQIENGTYARNLAKIGREAARTGSAIPEEILAAMPKRMREQVLRDRDAAIAIAKRRQQVDTEEELLTLSDAPAHAEPAPAEPPPPAAPKKTRSGAHIVSEDDAEIDFNAMFAAFDNAPSPDAPSAEPVKPPATTHGQPAARPQMPRMPVPHGAQGLPRSDGPAGSGASAIPRTTPAAGIPRPVGQQPSAPTSSVPTGQQSTSAIPRPIGQQPSSPTTSAIPRAVGQQPSSPTTSAIPRAVGQQPSSPTTSAIPYPAGQPQSGPVPRPAVGQPPSGAVPRPAVGQPPSGAVPRPAVGQPPSGAVPRPAVGQPPSGAVPRPAVGQPPSGAVPRPAVDQPTSAVPRPVVEQPRSGAVPRPAAYQATGPTPVAGTRPTPPIGTPTPPVGIPAIPAPPRQTSPVGIPAIPALGARQTPPAGIPAQGAARFTPPAGVPVPRPTPGAEIPRPESGDAIPRPAPSQQSRPIPVMPGAAAQAGPVPVESMSGPFPREQPQPKPTQRTTQSTPKPAAQAAPKPLKPPPGMTEADVNALHAKYVKAKEMVGEKVDAGSREKLLKTINQTAPKIMEQYQAKAVDFSIVVKDNQVIIKAKPKV